ncbi:hypothetical protein L226DRAFT_86975 [Lentinus tigrinus ALCF2SS1-7]|uniref:uncharacterized protein n=1 Tax=Lentinus tigrinus ALCF2SS1-7 TaxID=1328758 RepID=UPI001165FE22|nr:hypothetical protein L226DRAFT_86975 [Lentinus tigrinus ALCF2SS1-7]
MNSSNPTPSSSKASAAPNKPAPWSMDHWTSCLVTRKGTPLPRGTVAYAIGAAFPTEHLRHIAEAVCTPEQIEEEPSSTSPTSTPTNRSSYGFSVSPPAAAARCPQSVLSPSTGRSSTNTSVDVVSAPTSSGPSGGVLFRGPRAPHIQFGSRTCFCSSYSCRTRRGVPTPAQKAAKAAKMIRYLSKTHEKVEALVSVTHQGGVDPARVQVAMKILDAVSKALDFLRLKNSKAPGAR